MAETDTTHSNSSVLVTGARGFVGRAAVDALSKRGIAVCAVSRRPRAAASPARHLTWEQADLERADGWDRLLDGADTVVHLAGNPGTGPEDAMMRANRDWTAMLARRAARAGVGRFVYVSTVRVYGHQPTIDAATAPCPADAYGRSKLAAEEALLAVSAGQAMATSILRPPFVFGADRAGVLSLMAAASRYRVPLPLGSLRNRRSLISAGNLGDLIALAAVEDASRGVFRLPAAEGFDPTYDELFELFGRALGKSVATIPVPQGALRLAARAIWPAETVARLFEDCVVDGSTLAGRLGWHPGISPVATLRSILVAG